MAPIRQPRAEAAYPLHGRGQLLYARVSARKILIQKAALTPRIALLTMDGTASARTEPI